MPDNTPTAPSKPGEDLSRPLFLNRLRRTWDAFRGYDEIRRLSREIGYLQAKLRHAEDMENSPPSPSCMDCGAVREIGKPCANCGLGEVT